MVQMSPLIALQGRPADILGKMNQGQELYQNRQQSALNDLRLNEAKGEAEAVNEYREKVRTGDPSALESLKAYPETYSKYDEAFNKIADEKEKRTAIKRSRAIGQAARTVSMYPQGSRERQEVGERLTNDLVKQGYLTPQMAQQAKASGFSDLFLQQALDLDDWVKMQFKDDDEAYKEEKRAREAEKHAATMEYTKARTERAKQPPKGSKEKEGKLSAVERYRKAQERDQTFTESVVQSVKKAPLSKNIEEYGAPSKNIEDRTGGFTNQAGPGAGPGSELTPPVEGEGVPGAQWEYRTINGKNYVKAPDGRIFEMK